MKTGASLGVRMVTAVALVSTLSVGGLVGALLIAMHSHIHLQTDRMLLELARRDAIDVLEEERGEGVHVHEAPLSLPSLRGAVSEKYALVLDPVTCEVLAKTRNVALSGPPEALCRPLGPGAHEFLNIDGLSRELLRVARLNAAGHPDRRLSFVVGVAHDAIDESTWQVVRYALPGALLVVLVILGAAWWVAARVTRELRQLDRGCRNLASRGVMAEALPAQFTLPPESPRELQTLSRTLRQLLGELTDMLETQSRFIAEASHELNTPLTALRGELELALRRERSREEYREALEQAYGDTQRLIALAEHLLQAARARGEVLTLEPVPLADVLDECLERYHDALADVHVSVELPDAPVLASAHRLSLTQVLDNLIKNAILHATPSVLRVVVEVEEGAVGGRWVHLTLSDDGPGVPRSLAPHLFKPFQRASQERGHGLGLSIARDLMRRQGGDLRHLPEEPGATWRVSLREADVG